MPKLLAVAMIACTLMAHHASAQERFITKLKLPTGQTVVIAEGDFEARSTGSFSIRLYKAALAPDETTFFTSGLVRLREGTIEKVMLADVDGDEQPEIIVLVRSVGTGSYVSVQAFSFTQDGVVFRLAEDGLPPDADPVAALRDATR